MNVAGVIGLIVVIVVVVGIAVGVVFLLKSRREKERARIEAMSPAEREHHEAQREYDSNLKAAEKLHSSEAKARDGRLRAAQSAVQAAEKLGNRKLASYKAKDGSMTLYETSLKTEQGTFPIDATVSAVADTAGNLATSSQAKLGRIAAGGLLLGGPGLILGGIMKKTKIHDMRELYLLVDGPGFAALMTCDPDEGPKVRQFATAIKQAGLNAAGVLENKARSIAQAQAQLASEQANTAALEGAARNLDATRANTARLDAARAALPLEGPNAAAA